MPSKCYVFNEWLIHDLSGQNGPERQKAAHEVLVRVRDGEDLIAAGRNTPWMNKAFALMRARRHDVRQLSKLLHRGIIWDSGKCVLVDQSRLEPLPNEEARLLPQKDVYLVQVYRAASADLIVTTDEELLEKAGNLGIRIAFRDDFLTQYP